MFDQDKKNDRKIIKMQAEFMKALSHPTRIEIVSLLREKTLCVCEIVDVLGGEYSNISRHLAKLAGVGILSVEKKGTSVFYTLECPCVLNFFNCINDIIQRREKDNLFS